MESVNVRNLEQIHEDESGRGRSRMGTFLLAGIGIGAIVLAGFMAVRRSQTPARSASDPLTSLVAQAKNERSSPERLEGKDVTFPALLSDDGSPTTALAAVKDDRGRLVKADGTGAQPAASVDITAVQPAPGSPSSPPPPGDRLPVVPLPAAALLNATTLTTQPKDELSRLAVEQSKSAEGTATAPEGSEAGYQLQVASFVKQDDADKLVGELRKRGHSAFRQAAYVANRGLWHRVRVGPFKNRYEAAQYKVKFERQEHIVPFIIDPNKVKANEAPGGKRLVLRKHGVGDLDE